MKEVNRKQGIGAWGSQQFNQFKSINQKFIISSFNQKFVVESFQNLLQQVNTKDTERYGEILQKLTELINYLINHHFERLVQLLYTVDVDELQLKQALRNNSDRDAAQIVAELVLQRQIQKVIARQNFSGNAPDIPEEERW